MSRDRGHAAYLKCVSRCSARPVARGAISAASCCALIAHPSGPIAGISARRASTIGSGCVVHGLTGYLHVFSHMGAERVSIPDENIRGARLFIRQREIAAGGRTPQTSLNRSLVRNRSGLAVIYALIGGRTSLGASCVLVCVRTGFAATRALIGSRTSLRYAAGSRRLSDHPRRSQEQHR